MQSNISIISVVELNQLLSTLHNNLYLLDVREIQEFNICHIPSSHHIPLAELSKRLTDLPKNKNIITICHHGVRSARAAAILNNAGFDQVCNLSGGVHAWAQQIDLTMPVY
jgi:rhodanese-related sulfurtransferase